MKAGCTQTSENLIRRALASVQSVAQEKHPMTSKTTKPLCNPDKIVIVTHTENYAKTIHIKK